MAEIAIVVCVGGEAAAGEQSLEHVAVVSGRLALPQPENVGQT